MLEARATLTKSEILERATDTQIMSYYLGITPSGDLVTSPFRSDTKPGCSF